MVEVEWIAIIESYGHIDYQSIERAYLKAVMIKSHSASCWGESW